MKHFKQTPQLHLYRTGEAKTDRRLFTQKHLDVTLVIVSLAGLFHAVAFLLTMYR